jgi:hypothetical protein
MKHNYENFIEICLKRGHNMRAINMSEERMQMRLSFVW